MTLEDFMEIMGDMPPDTELLVWDDKEGDWTSHLSLIKEWKPPLVYIDKDWLWEDSENDS